MYAIYTLYSKYPLSFANRPVYDIHHPFWILGCILKYSAYVIYNDILKYSLHFAIQSVFQNYPCILKYGAYFEIRPVFQKTDRILKHGSYFVYHAVFYNSGCMSENLQSCLRLHQSWRQETMYRRLARQAPSAPGRAITLLVRRRPCSLKKASWQ